MTDPARIPTQDDVLEYFTTLSNWGRWGPDDELGTLNLITPAKRLEAAALVQAGTSVGCARPLAFEERAADVMYPPLRFMIRAGDDPASTGAAEFLGVAMHGQTVSHIDALSHQFWGGRVYNDRPQTAVDTIHGATTCSIEVMRNGIVTRGVLADIPRLRGVPYLEPEEPIMPEELDAALDATGVTIGAGDALLVRTGFSQRRIDVGPPTTWRARPGLHAATLPWIRERDIAVIAADAAQDVGPSGYEAIQMPVHSVGIVGMGLTLLDNLQFDDLAVECERLGRWEFMFVVAPIRIRNGTGSPVTPLAVF